MKNFKTFFLASFFIMMSISLFSQNTVTGIVSDSKNNETLPGASVILKGTTIGTVTDFDGKFKFNVSASGSQTLIISYVGYVVKEVPVNISGTTDVGTVTLESDAIGLEEVNVISSVAIDRKTPVAVSTISSEQIENEVGNQEFPEILKATPSIYATKQGGGYGDARINVRGFNQRNVAVLINGIPVNDMENGWVYWSNWAGLSDVTRTMQIQRGLGASKLAINSVGGTINIITKTTDAQEGGSLKVGFGNDGYFKEALTLSTGKLKGGWAFTFSGSRTQGEGYVDKTWIDAWSYFGSITKTFGTSHMLVLTAIGAPQRHGQRSYQEKASTYEEKGYKFNSDWGTLNGETYNLRKNFYHKPQIALNHYWTFSEKTSLSTSLYTSFGRGGGTGDYGKLIDDKETADKSDDKSYYIYSFRTADGQIDYQKVYDYNSGKSDIVASKTFINTADDNGLYKSAYAMRASMNEHNWYGMLSTFKHSLTDNLELIAGIDLRSYEGRHYRQIEDLLGGDYYTDYSDVNRQGGYNVGVGDKVNYDNDGHVRWYGAFTQLEYSVGNLTVFGAANLSNVSFMRVDRFNYTPTEGQESDWQTFNGYGVKAGANYNLTKIHNVYINGGYFSKTPKFDDIFVNYKNDLATEINNEEVISIEFGYGLRTSFLSANINLYNTIWKNKAFQVRYENTNGDRLFANLVGQNAEHRGVEIDLISEPIKNLKIIGMVAINDWKWKNNVSAKVYDENNTFVKDIFVYADGLYVGDAAQITGSIGLKYKLPYGFSVDARWMYYDKNYAKFDPDDRTDDTDTEQAYQIPGNGELDMGLSYFIKFKKFKVLFRANVNNVTDEIYLKDVTDGSDHTYNTANGYYGFGRTWNVSMKVSF